MFGIIIIEYPREEKGACKCARYVLVLVCGLVAVKVVSVWIQHVKKVDLVRPHRGLRVVFGDWDVIQGVDKVH